MFHIMKQTPEQSNITPTRVAMFVNVITNQLEYMIND